MAGEHNRDRWRRYWDKQSPSYDKQMRFWERVPFADSRSWVCGQATGDTLEVAVGTGLNLPFYPAGAELTGIDFSPAMLGVAQTRARQLGRAVDLRQADAPRAAVLRCPLRHGGVHLRAVRDPRRTPRGR
jgi:SAM-dependent methyltransferase